MVAGRLSGKVCVVTGTGGSMGRATALTFAREGASVVGCDVAVETAEETVALVAAAGGEMVSLQPCILSDPAECARLVDFAVSEYGRIDVLFNLAGRSHFGRVEAVSDEEILDAYHWLAANEGVFCEPASAASVAGLLAHGLPVLDGAEPPESVVCVLTGHGLKDPDTALSKAPPVINCENDFDAVERAVFA